MSLNRVPVARHGPKLSEDEAIPSRMFFILVWRLSDVIFGAFWSQMGPRGSRTRDFL